MAGGDTAITVGTLVLFTAYISQFWTPINTLAGFYNSLLTAISYLERIFETIDEDVAVKDAPDAMDMPPITGKVEFKDVTFSYDDGHPSLNKNNLTANPAETFALFTAYISQFWTPINTLAGFYNSLLTAISYLERIFETIDEDVAVKDAPDAMDMPPITGKVEFKDVTFSYDDGHPILNKINFTANPGETFAIVGPTGAGKTTIVNLISRFYNVDSGEVLIDDIDISKVKIHSLRTQMGIMMQDSFIFSGTIMDNIRYGNMEASDEDVIRAAKTVCAHDFIMEMENGYMTEVNERGSRLSAGQRQLISFARADRKSVV